VAEDDGDGAGVEAGVDVVQDCAGEGDGEVELVHGGDVGGHDGDDAAAADTKGGEGGGQLEASAARLGPREGGVVINNGRDVAVDGGCSVQEAEGSERGRVSSTWLQLFHNQNKIGIGTGLMGHRNVGEIYSIIIFLS